MSDFLVPTMQEESSIYPPKKASENAFYTAAAVGGDTPVETYDQVRADLEQTGVSSLMEGEQLRWNNEQDKVTKETVVEILADNTISNDIKKAVMRGYALTGSIETSLKDRYIQKTASVDAGNTVDDSLVQDDIANNLANRVNKNTRDTIEEKTVEGASTISDYVKAGSSILANIAMSVPAGIVGMIQLIKEQDNDKASEAIKEVMSYAYSPTEEGARQLIENVTKAAEYVGIPAKEIGQFTFNTTKFWTQSDAAAATMGTAAEVILDPLNFIPVGLAIKSTKTVKKVTPKVDVDSPLNTTNVANPKAAENLGTAVVKDGTGKLAAGTGVDRGAVVHDWILPKILPDEVARMHPDLTEQIIASDVTARTTFEDLRYDPNIINATEREAEVGRVFQVIKESRTPYYNQSMSLINETDNLFEGKAIFSRNGHSGYIRESDANKAFASLKESISQLPKEEQGTLSLFKEDNQYHIKWEWKREYNRAADMVFSKDSIQTSFLGMDVSGISRSKAGRFLFPTGKFPTWVEHGAMRGVERSAKMQDVLTKTIRDNISNTKHGRELDHLINDAEERGIDYYSPETISAMFPKLSVKEAGDLFETHTYWRRQQQYNHNFMNREHRHRLVADNMQGMYDKAGNYLGAATSKVGPAEQAAIREVWDFDTGTKINFDPLDIEKKGQTLVRLQEKIKGKGEIHQYGVTGTSVKLDLLPQEVLARVPGYSGRKVAESFFVDVIPKKLRINGLLEHDANGLRTYAETHAAAKNEAEGNKIAAELQKENPDSIIEVRPERTDNWGKILTDYQMHQTFLKHSMKRGDRLPSLDGVARIEDRMVTLLNTTNSLSRMGAFRAWDDAFQTSFNKAFSKFTHGEFPQYATDIKPLENMGRAAKQEYDTAHSLFKYYEQMKNTETRGDFLWTKGMNGLADILEKFRVPAESLRGNHKNPMMMAKTVATVAYIHLAPIRQWLIQPAQQLEMYAISPTTAAKNFTSTFAIRMYLGADSNMIKQTGSSDLIKANAKLAAERAGNKEFLEDVEAIKKSGLMQSVDMNSIVHGVFKETDRNLVENIPERIWKDIITAGKAVPRAARAVGFDAAELTNRVGNWLQVKDMWKLKNPEKKWNTKEALEEISAEANKLSGAMNRAGQLPYQDGVASIFFQFAAINQKMVMNLLQDNATILTKPQRARLAAARFALYGGKYGIPGGAIAYHFIEQSSDEEVKKAAETIKRGAIDYSANNLLAAIVEPDEKPDLAVSKILSPYSEGFLPYFQVGWETLKLFDNKPTSPRYPAFGMISSFGQATEDISGWWATKEVNETNYKQMFMEAAETASGFNSYSQGLLMLGMKDKISKMGNKYGMEFTKSEAYAKMLLGIGTGKEEDLWKIVELEGNIKKQKTEMAKMIYRQMENQRVKGNEEEYATRVRKVNAFINLLDPTHFSEADKLDVIAEIEKIDTHNFTTIKQSILQEHWKYHQQQRTQEWQQVDDILRRSPDPEVQKYIKALDEGKL